MGQDNPYAKYATPVNPYAGYVAIGDPDPTYQFKAPEAEARLASARAAAQEAAAKQPYDAEIAKANRDRAVAEASLVTGKADEAKANASLANMTPNSQLHGEGYLHQYVPQAQWGLVRAYARGDIGSRAGGMSTSMLPVIQHAMNYDPTTSATTFPARVKMQQDLAGNQPGTAGGALRSMEQMLLHGNNVLTTGQGLNNFGPGLLGSAGNAVRTGLMRAEHDPLLNAYEQEVKNYAPESQKGVAGAAGIGAEREERAAGYAPSLPQASRAAGLQADARMALERIGAVNDQYKRLMGRDITDQLSPAAQKAYDNIMAGGYDANGNALHPAPGYVPGSVFGPASPSGTGGGGSGSGPPPMGPATPGASIATGPTKRIPNPQANALMDSMLRSGATDEQINSALASMGVPAAKAADTARVRAFLATPDGKAYTGGFGNVYSDVPTTAMERVAASPMATGIVSAGNAALAGLPGALTGTTPQMQAMAALNPKSALIGDMAGSTSGAMGVEGLLGKIGGNLAARYGASAATRALASPVAADATFGGVSGASSDFNDPLAGASIGALASVGGGMFGRGFTRFAGQATRGIQNGAVNLLRDAGVPLTVGQASSNSGFVGKAIKGLEDKLTSAPIVGDMVRARRLDGMKGFNRAAFDQGLAPIGVTTNGMTGEAGVDAAFNATGQGYRDALSGVSLSGDVPFRTAVKNAFDKGVNAPTYGGDFSTIMKGEISPIVAGSPVIGGEQFQALKRTLGGYAGQYDRIATGTPMVPPAPMARNVASAFDDLNTSLDDLVARQAPGTLPAYTAANSAYRNTNILQDATNRARNGTRVGEPGTFAPSQLADAAAANSRTFGGTQGTTNQPFYDLTRAGQQVLPSSIPDSGTAGRIATLALPSLLGGGLGWGLGDAKSGGEAGAATGLGLGAALALGGTRIGQRALVAGLLDRPDTMVRIGNQLVKRRAFGGMFGAGLGATLAAH